MKEFYKTVVASMNGQAVKKTQGEIVAQQMVKNAIIDPFLGSRSTLVAADRTGRVCRGVEFDPLYVDVIVRRYQVATGNPGAMTLRASPSL
jgi:hypothetical protein